MINNVQPVLLGGDLNCYSVARAFHEYLGVKSIAFGKMELGVIKHSRIVEFKTAPQINDKEYMVKTLRNLGEKLKKTGRTAILMGCSDIYVSMIIDCKDQLEDLYILPYPSKELKNKMLDKQSFYELCEKYGVAYPKTATYDPAKKNLPENLMYPLILKPANPIKYWKKRFEGMEKIYFAKNLDEVKYAINSIYSGDYDENIIIQEYIPGDDSKIWTPTCYSDKTGRAKMVVTGHVLLEEHVPTARGNDAAIINEHNQALAETMVDFLDKLGFVGFTNADVKYDERDHKFKIFEINIRQGRSNYSVTAGGSNIAELVTEDYVLGKELKLVMQKKPYFWSLVPDSVIKKHVPDKALVNKAMTLKKQGNYASTLFYDYDLKLNPKRYFYVTANFYNHIRKFNKYYTKGDGVK